MIQRTFKADNKDEIEKIAAEIKAEPLYDRCRDRLIIIWAEIWNENSMEDYSGRAAALFHDCHIVGMSFNQKNVILSDVGHEGCIQVTAMLFERSEVSLFSKAKEDLPETVYGKELRAFLDSEENVKGVYLVPPWYFFSVDPLLQEASKGYEDIPFFGIKTTINPGFSTFCYSPEDTEVSRGGFVAVAFKGEDLNITAKYSLGWTPVGKMMTITDMENPFVLNSIDGLPASDVYKRYLGLEEDEIQPLNICEFPLVVHKNNWITARIGMLGPVKGQLQFGIPFEKDDVLQLSYGDPESIFESARADSADLMEFDPEAELLFVCVNRLLLLKEEESRETAYFTDGFPEAADVYGYAEILRDGTGGGELNSALLSIAFREGPKKQHPGTAEIKTDQNKPAKNGIVPLEYRLFTFFKEMSKDLKNSAEEAEMANRAKTDFLSNVSHEIRTPINAILGMDEMILRETAQDEVKKYAANIRESGRLLLGLINDLLDTARIESGKLNIIPVNYDLASALDDLCNIVGIRAEAKGLLFNTVIDPSIPRFLNGDETRVKQCALNLLNNAVKYTLSGTVTLEVSYEKKSDDSILLKISVSDTGIGIKESDLDKLFKPFERIEEARNYSVEGAGLGLNIVISLLKMMDSTLNVSSEYGKGSVFSFEVLQKVDSWEEMGDFDRSKRETFRMDSEYKEAFTAPDAHILIVDDTEMNLVVMRGLLKKTEISIDTATGGREALELIKENKYDIIFLDKQMPELDGLKVLEKIRKDRDHKNTDTPCVVLTADATSGTKEYLLKQGFDDYISKPVESAELEKTIMKHLPGKKITGNPENGSRTSASTSSTEKELEAFRSIPEIDYDAALKNCIDEENLLDAVASFRKMFGSTSSLLKEYADKDDLENFTIKAHALKSSAAIIGAMHLSAGAARLERYGKTGESGSVADELAGFLKEYEELARGLDALEKAKEEAPAAEDSSKSRITEADLMSTLRRIMEMTEDFDYEGALFSLQILEKFDLSEHREDVRKVKELIKDFEGEAALELLREMIK
ncbi:MAG: response regulator [Lachnospiraceae bacterium]|nr:response regulator [Lachnospiraceae bacterium]